jgi:hypothetical protein
MDTLSVCRIAAIGWVSLPVRYVEASYQLPSHCAINRSINAQGIALRSAQFQQRHCPDLMLQTRCLNSSCGGFRACIALILAERQLENSRFLGEHTSKMKRSLLRSGTGQNKPARALARNKVSAGVRCDTLRVPTRCSLARGLACRIGGVILQQQRR